MIPSRARRQSNWNQSNWLGYFYLPTRADTGNFWMYHACLGWVYLLSSSPSDGLFRENSQAGLWTKKSTFPYLYDKTANLYLTDSGSAMGWNQLDRFPVRRISQANSPGTIPPTRPKRINDRIGIVFLNTSKPMKSAYELAMERSDDGDGKPLTDQQKEQIAEIDSKYKAKIAERKIVLEKAFRTRLCKRNTRKRKKPAKF